MDNRTNIDPAEEKTCATCGRKIKVGERAFMGGIVDDEGFDTDGVLVCIDPCIKTLEVA